MKRTVPTPRATSNDEGTTAPRATPGDDPGTRGQLRRGQELGRYLVLERVGAGGMGVVYAAYDPELDRRLAIKLVSTAGEDESRARARAHELLREGRVLARLTHPNVVTIHDVGRLGDDVFIAMEYVQGRTLDEWIARESPEMHRILEHCVAAGRGLAAAHREGIVHGDFKPANVMVAADGRVVVLDFGLARAVAGDDPSDSLLVTTAGGAGTPAYMAPEQHEGREPGPAADQFGFCVTLYEALCGHRPFEGEDRVGLALRVLEGQVREPGDAMPAWLWRVVRRGLAVDPRQRYGSFEDLLGLLDPARRRRRRRRWWIGLGALLVPAALGTRLLTPGPCDDPHAALRDAWDPAIGEQLDRRWEHQPAWPYVRAGLERTAAGWQDHWSDACRATHVDRTQSSELLDRRLACLEGYRGPLAAFVERLAAPETTDATFARLAARVPSLDAGAPCANARIVLGRAPPPVDPDARETFDQIIAEAQRWIERVNADRSGQPREALHALESLHERAEALDHPDALRWVWQCQGDVLDALGRHEEAAEAYARAQHHAEVAGDDVAALTTASTLIHLHSSLLDDNPGARVWSDVADGKLARVDVVPRSALIGLRIHQATLARRDGEPEAAIELLEWALEQAGDDPAQRGTIHHNLGLVRSNLLENELAIEEFRRALELRTQALGGAHFIVAQSQYHLALALAAAGEFPGAYEALDEAIRIFEGTEGVDRERIAAAAARAIFAASEGRLDEAIAMGERTLQAAIPLLGPDDLEVSTLQFNLARMLMLEGRLDEAFTLAVRSLATEERRSGLHHPGLHMELSLLAEISLRQGRPLVARQYLIRGRSLAPSTVRMLQFDASIVYAQLHIDCDLVEARRAQEALLDEYRTGAETSPGLEQLLSDLEAGARRWDEDAWPKTCPPLSEPSAWDPAPPR